MPAGPCGASWEIVRFGRGESLQRILIMHGLGDDGRQNRYRRRARDHLGARRDLPLPFTVQCGGGWLGFASLSSLLFCFLGVVGGVNAFAAHVRPRAPPQCQRYAETPPKVPNTDELGVYALLVAL